MFLLSLTRSIYISYACNGVNIVLKEGAGNSSGQLGTLLILFCNSHQPRTWAAPPPASSHSHQAAGEDFAAGVPPSHGPLQPGRAVPSVPHGVSTSRCKSPKAGALWKLKLQQPDCPPLSNLGDLSNRSSTWKRCEGQQPDSSGGTGDAALLKAAERHWLKLAGILALQAMFADFLQALWLVSSSFS